MYSLGCEVSPPRGDWLLDFMSPISRLGCREPKKSKLLATWNRIFRIPNLPGLGFFGNPLQHFGSGGSSWKMVESFRFLTVEVMTNGDWVIEPLRKTNELVWFWLVVGCLLSKLHSLKLTNGPSKSRCICYWNGLMSIGPSPCLFAAGQ